MECCELLGQTECYIRPLTIDNLLTYKTIFKEDQKGKEIQREPEEQNCQKVVQAEPEFGEVYSSVYKYKCTVF
jgi:hypothetical protein